jgi:hypothetical protein
VQITAILATFSAVLSVDIDLAAGKARSAVIETGKGIYFGLTRDTAGGLLLAARNRDAAGRIRARDVGTDIIYALDPRTGATSPRIVHSELADLHQIRRIGRFLCIVQGRGSRLMLFDLHSGALTRTIDLAAFVPAHLRHGPVAGHEDDLYHFNSIGWSGDQNGGRLWILAHNWGDSFALEFAAVIDELGPALIALVATHEALGRAAHDIAGIEETLLVLDSAGGRLIARGAADIRVDLPRHSSPIFARGLAVTASHILVSYGFWSSEKFARVRSPTRLCVLDRASLTPVGDFDLGDHGNSSDVRVISEPDFCDIG